MTDNPFGGLFGDLFSVLGQQGPDAWFDTAKTLALNVVRQADNDPNPDPSERQRLERFSPLVARHVAALLSVTGSDTVDAATRSTLTLTALDQWRPLIQPMVDAPPPSLEGLDPSGANVMGQLAATLGPLFTGFQLGSIAGHFSERAWSMAALPLPRTSSAQILVVNNVATFAQEWSLDPDTTSIFAVAREMAAATILSQPGTGDALRAILLDAVRDAMAVQGDIVSRLQSMVNPDDLASLMGNPESLLDGLELPEHTPAVDAINAAAAALRSVLDTIGFTVTESIVGPATTLREAYLRYRLSDARGEDAAAALFGISHQGEHQTQADAFVYEIVENHGIEAFAALLRVDGLPSASELWTPEEWFQRVTNSPLA